jgi:glycosyltransferase domain-containing protein
MPGSSGSPDLRYTLVIPTYNRPDQLARLVRCLAYQGAGFPVIVLDSSREEVHARNAAACAKSGLDVRVERFAEDIPPWEKFRRGAQTIRTEYSSLCADDDLLVVSAVARVTEFLDGHGDYSAAHGWYFHFHLNGGLGLTGIAYQGPPIDANEPLARLRSLFSRYEPLTYAVYRTRVMTDALERTREVRSMLGRELLGGAVTVLAGKVMRLPLLYLGRSLGPSGEYVDWHPAEFLLSSPQSLFEEYGRYRAAVLAWLSASGLAAGEREKRIIDLIHLRYLDGYLRPEVLDYLIEQLPLGRPREEVMDGMRPLLARKAGLEGRLQRSRVLRRLLRRFAPWMRAHHVRRMLRLAKYSTLPQTTASGKARKLELHPAFSRSCAEAGLETSADGLLAALRGYE